MTRFGGGAGMGGGYGSGGGPGGTGMFRAVSRVARAGLSNLQDPSSPSSASSSSSSSNSPRNASKRGLTFSNNTLTAIASPSVSLSNSICGFGSAWPLTSSSSLCDETEWIRVHDEFYVEDENGSFDDSVFGSVPSPHEVTSALLSLQQALPTSSSSDWMEPSLHMYGYDQRLYPGIGRVFDALHLLQTDSSVQRMVISLSSDRAVWDAILNNEAVRELRESYYSDEETNDSESSDDESNPHRASTNLLSWIIDNMRSKLMEFLAGITNLIKEAFQAADNEQQTDGFPDGFGDKVRASFMLTAILLLIVVMSRASQA